jgi:hypothetical protein
MALGLNDFDQNHYIPCHINNRYINSYNLSGKRVIKGLIREVDATWLIVLD